MEGLNLGRQTSAASARCLIGSSSRQRIWINSHDFHLLQPFLLTIPYTISALLEPLKHIIHLSA